MCVKYVYMCSVSAVYVCGLCMHVWCVWRMSLCMLWCVCVVYMYAVQFIRENTVWNGTAKVVVTCLFVPHNITGLWYEEKEK